MITSNVINETDTSFQIEITPSSGKTYTVTLAKVGGFATDELVSRWTRRFSMEFRRDRVNFDRYVNRITARHEKIISGEIEPIISEQ